MKQQIDCICNEWKINIQYINGCILMSEIHHCPLPSIYTPFKYCPWCGKLLNREESNETTD